jgi:hypothetical protein
MGISKLCCPPCYYLLSKILLINEVPFLVRGSHGTTGRSALPLWLPEPFVLMMNSTFCVQLSEQLVDIVENTNAMRNRTKSTGSERLSVDTRVPGSQTYLHKNLKADLGKAMGDKRF